jgi:hypothetical protein
MKLTPKTTALEVAFMEGRGSALSQLRDWQEGQRPKNPDANDAQIAALVESLSPEQQSQLRVLLAHFTDTALFKLLVGLESGIPGYRFRLSAICEETGAEQKFIEDEVDHDLIHEFFDWVRAQA